MSTELISLTTSCPDKPEYNGEFPLLVTDIAVKHFIEANGDGLDFVRVMVQGGGCSGFRYELDFVEKANENDIKEKFDVEEGGITLIIDPKSAHVLQGTTIDYVISKLGSSGFKFTGGDKVKRTCGCGESFSI